MPHRKTNNAVPGDENIPPTRVGAPRSGVTGLKSQGTDDMGRQAPRPDREMEDKGPAAVQQRQGLHVRTKPNEQPPNRPILRPRNGQTGAVVTSIRRLRPRVSNKRAVVTNREGPDDRQAVPASPRSLPANRTAISARSTHALSAHTEQPHVTPGIKDIDAADDKNWMCEPVYVNDIYKNYKKMEATYHTAPDVVAWQADIDERLYASLMDWLVEVHRKFKFKMAETLFLTVQIVNRYLAIDQVQCRNVQLVGVTAMLIASKYEEIWAPEVHDFVYISAGAYTREQILGMEKMMLNKLQFKLTTPTSYHFLARFIKACGQTEAQFNHLCMYAIEIALIECNMLKYTFSKLSAAAVLVARERMGTGPWTAELKHHTGYSVEELVECAGLMKDLMTRAGRLDTALKAVHKKYSSRACCEVANLFPPQE
eukprot:jgi/Tetstr1/437972/TSEL_026602.t1